ncbi:RNA-binding protein, G-patch type, splicing factor 45 ortholog [Schizosaccharomyces pombe]|uniref:Uncharacterized protein C2G11.04 n=1 Tax=Schizosaccharomyces pombe (strain 972 / ATCC 24843) TaxID=284812 RepID=YAB4_SCHPO|nr:putative G-patch type RNA-binding protein [Schizosaccharomyces pombe]Q09806.1 RecName: Full=Uncharacterized protein C2G11.04 [Schizosaccharomyces pombe 972h-]CAA91169.1 RNA-binding protein, G-patch type (predicted) [Schizosaccharomyces pombe]|eukprot:NP_593084.1 putative G-patch type RNA-binding protein [Schizosaccharomyces pombe]
MGFMLYEGIDSKSIEEITEESEKTKTDLQKANTPNKTEAVHSLNNTCSEQNSGTKDYLNSLQFLPSNFRPKTHKKKKSVSSYLSSTIQKNANENIPHVQCRNDSQSTVTTRNPTPFKIEVGIYPSKPNNLNKEPPASTVHSDNLGDAVEHEWVELYDPLFPTSYSVFKESDYANLCETNWSHYVNQVPSLSIEAKLSNIVNASKSGIGPPPSLLSHATLARPSESMVLSNNIAAEDLDFFKKSPPVPAISKKENVALKMLQRCGWKEGQGLGQHNQGIINPLHVEISGFVTETKHSKINDK